MSYDRWKTRSPDDEIDYGEPPEVWVTCPDCGGEGAIEVWEGVKPWAVDPPCSHTVFCERCVGAGGWIEDAA